MTKKDKSASGGSGGAPPKEKEKIEGLDLIAPASLGPEFRRFRHDDLYFINVVQYFPRDAKPQPRCVALTPVAFFITDVNGNMDRATRCELLSEAFYQIQTIKKLIGSEQQVHFVIKIPKEYDVHFAFEKEKDNKAAMKFTEVLQKLCTHRQRRPFNVTVIPPEAKFADYYNAEAPKGFMSPQEIIRANNERKLQQEQIQLTMNEIVKLEKQLETLKKATAQKQELLSQLESAVGVDNSALRSEKQRLADEHVAEHRQHTMLEIDMVKLNADILRAQEQLSEQKANRERLVQERIQEADSSAVNQQNEMMLLRQKSQKREIDKSTVKLDNLRAKLATPCEYSGPENLVTRVKELEAKVDQAVQRWEREMDSANKVDKFLDTINIEIEKVGRTVGELHDEKARLLRAREDALKAAQPQPQSPPPAAAAAAAASPAKSAAPLDDDDLLGGDAKPAAAAKPAAGGDLFDDDDLLGGGGAAPAKPAAAAAVADDDDLLGGGDAPAAAPAAAAAPAEEVGDLL